MRKKFDHLTKIKREKKNFPQILEETFDFQQLFMFI